MQGGIADYTANLAHHLTAQGIESTVLISRRWQGAPPANPAVHAVLPNWGWRCWPAIARYVTTRCPAVLHIQYQAAAFDLGGWVNWLPWYLARRRLPVRVITTFHDVRVPYIFPKAGPLRWHSMLALARHSHAVICTNREDLHTLAAALKSSPRLVHIPLGSNADPQPPANFDRDAWRAGYGLGPDALLLAYFGFLNQSKGGEELIEAMAILRAQGTNAHLLLIGGEVGHADPTNAAYAAKVQALIDQRGLAGCVHRTGFVDLPAVSANLLAADVVVMPYRDGVSFRRTTLIAALRHGCPVVSTAPPRPQFVPEVQPGHNMLLAPPANAGALAQAIAPLATDMRLRESLAAGARQLGSLFEWEQIATQTAQLYRQLGVNG
jgi:glycosyltransferase involved in cell wall biosynthesis